MSYQATTQAHRASADTIMARARSLNSIFGGSFMTDAKLIEVEAITKEIEAQAKILRKLSARR